jgi:hypothetical protein
MTDARARDLADLCSALLARILRGQPDLTPVQAATVSTAVGATLARELRAIAHQSAADADTDVFELVSLTRYYGPTPGGK